MKGKRDLGNQLPDEIGHLKNFSSTIFPKGQNAKSESMAEEDVSVVAERNRQAQKNLSGQIDAALSVYKVFLVIKPPKFSNSIRYN